MVTQYCLHRVSAQGHFATVAQSQAALGCMLSRIDRLRPLLEKGLARLLCDRMVNMATLDASGKNIAALANMSRDFAQRWFLAMKNRAALYDGNEIAVTAVDLPNRASTVTGLVPSQLVRQDYVWMSFRGTGAFDSLEVEVAAPGVLPLKLGNCFDEASLIRSWPVYERSPKHRLEEYQRNGVVVSPMDLSDADAQAALTVAQAFGGSLYAEVRSKIYRFLPTSAGSIPPTYHGFRVTQESVPSGVFDLLNL